MAADQFFYLLTFPHLGCLFGTLAHILLGGIGWALFGFLINIAWPRLYGLGTLDLTVGISLSFTILTNALSPLLYAIVKSIFGSYRSIFYGWEIPVTLLYFSLARRSFNPFHEEKKDSRPLPISKTTSP
jgi:hypothetical protein